MEYRGLFASAGAYSSTQGGSQSRSEDKFMSTSIQALGGHQRIAAAVTDLYAPTFKNTLVVSVHICLYFIINLLLFSSTELAM